MVIEFIFNTHQLQIDNDAISLIIPYHFGYASEIFLLQNQDVRIFNYLLSDVPNEKSSIYQNIYIHAYKITDEVYM